MNRKELEKILPHRSNMLLLDSAYVDEEGTAHASKRITGEEFFLDGHFPGNPIVPGVILCEILAQSACVLLNEDATGVTTLLTGLDKVKFKNMVRPGDTFETKVKLIWKKGVFYHAEGEGSVNGKLCVSAQFTFAIIKREEEA